MNYETNKIIFICYPPGAGGKFLINCLGLSDMQSATPKIILTLQKNKNKNILKPKLQDMKRQMVGKT